MSNITKTCCQKHLIWQPNINHCTGITSNRNLYPHESKFSSPVQKLVLFDPTGVSVITVGASFWAEETSSDYHLKHRHRVGGFNRRPSFYCPASVRDHWALTALQLFLFSTDYRLLCSNTKTQLTLGCEADLSSIHMLLSWHRFLSWKLNSLTSVCLCAIALLDLLLELLLINSFRTNLGCCMWTATNG